MTDTSRRTFLATGRAALLSAQSPNDTIRVAFIGVGNRGSFLLNDAESARRSTLTAMLGHNLIYEKRIVEGKEVDV